MICKNDEYFTNAIYAAAKLYYGGAAWKWKFATAPYCFNIANPSLK